MRSRVTCVDVLREEELDLLVRKVAKLGAEDVVDADMVGISPAVTLGQRTSSICGSAAVQR